MPNYCLFFSGEIQEDFELEEVKTAFKSYFNLSDDQIEEYFFGNEITIQSNLSQTDALLQMAAIEEMGGISYFLPLDDEIKLPENVESDRRTDQRRKGIRRASFRAGVYSDRRHGGDRRKSVYKYA